MIESATCDTSYGISTAPLGWTPPRYAWALLGLGSAAHLFVAPDVVLRLPIVGVLVLALGLWMAVGAKRRFRKLGLALAPNAAPTALLTDGWFGITRNPMYVGIAGFLLGVGLLLGSLPALLPAPLFLLLVRRWFVPGEEERLTSLGADWDRYSRRVPRWL